MGMKCTKDDPQGKKRDQAVLRQGPSQQDWDSGKVARDAQDFHDGITPMERGVIDATDRAMAPWNAFNDLFGGAAAPEAGGNVVPRYIP